MKHILYTISLLVLLGACTDEAFNDEPSAAGGGKPGKPVPVNLSLNLQPLQSPLDADTKAGSQVVSSTEVCKGMEISLVKTPVAPETRALADEVKNFCVFQFDGTKPESKLVKKLCITGSSVETVELIPSGSAKNRIIVIANADADTFNDVKVESGIYTLEQFNNLGSTYEATKSYYPLFLPTEATGLNQPRPILVGSADIVVVPTRIGRYHALSLYCQGECYSYTGKCYARQISVMDLPVHECPSEKFLSFDRARACFSGCCCPIWQL